MRVLSKLVVLGVMVAFAGGTNAMIVIGDQGYGQKKAEIQQIKSEKKQMKKQHKKAKKQHKKAMKQGMGGY
jgi:hypothetical protein